MSHDAAIPETSPPPIASNRGDAVFDALRRIRLFSAASGATTASLIGEDGWERILHSRIDPLLEALEWAWSQEHVRDCAVLVGTGLGYPAAALLEAHRGIRELWLLDSEPFFLDSAMKSPALSGAGCTLRPFATKSESEIRDILLPLLHGIFSIHVSPFAFSLEPVLYGAAVSHLEGRLREIRLEREKAGQDDFPAATLVERLILEIGS